MQTSIRPSPRLTLPQNLLTSGAQACCTAWTAAATRSRILDWADALDGIQTNAKVATEKTAVLVVVNMVYLLS